ncbi:hypothetical protein AAFC00_006332 [Neodothiora populina]|uniref:Uncharacterized protein n=1 Tax=Neodothiora populina TaxID=2781224 RepID=A0ABR3P4T2_9PEZI
MESPFMRWEMVISLTCMICEKDRIFMRHLRARLLSGGFLTCVGASGGGNEDRASSNVYTFANLQAQGSHANYMLIRDGHLVGPLYSAAIKVYLDDRSGQIPRQARLERDIMGGSEAARPSRLI